MHTVHFSLAVSHKLPVLDSKMATNPAAFLVLAPKETELVLDIIDEFVFFTKSSISKSRRLTSQGFKDISNLT